MGGECRRGPTCITQVGDAWVDGGTSCRSKSNSPGVLGTSAQIDSIAPSSGGEFPTLQVVENDTCNVSIEFEAKDLSIGKARYTGAKHIDRNLASKPTIPGRPDDLMAHANVEVHLYDAAGNEVPMTRRLVRYWYVKPAPNAVVDDLKQWRIVGADPSEFSPFGVSSGEQPASKSFEWDRASIEDAPALQGSSMDREPFGQLQEFLVGNPKAGGAYYQIYVLEDRSKARVISTNALKLSAKEFVETVRWIDSGEYAKTMGRKLYFLQSAGKDTISVFPKR